MPEEKFAKEENRKRKLWRLSPWHVAALVVCALLLLAALALAVSSFASAPTPPFIKETDIFKKAQARAASSQAVKAKIGTPCDDGAFFRGSIEDGAQSGKACFTIRFSGPSGKGVLSVDAVKADGEWKFGLLEFLPAGETQPLNLLLEAPPER